MKSLYKVLYWAHFRLAAYGWMLSLFDFISLNLLFTDEHGIEDLFDDYSLAHIKQKIFRNDTGKSKENPLSAPCEHMKLRENPISPQIPSTTQVNFLECEESNGEDDDEEEEADTLFQITKCKPSESGMPSVVYRDLADTKPDALCLQAHVKAAEDKMPKWSAFFKSSSAEGEDVFDTETNVETSGDDKKSLNLDHDSDDDSTHISSMNSSQSTHISEQGSQGWDSQGDTVLLSSQERRAAEMASGRRSSSVSECFLPGETKPEGGQGDPNCSHIDDAKKLHAGLSKNQDDVLDQTNNECERTACSQGSPDFEIPSSPGAELPHPAKLHYLYHRIATGDAIATLLD